MYPELLLKARTTGLGPLCMWIACPWYKIIPCSTDYSCHLGWLMPSAQSQVSGMLLYFILELLVSSSVVVVSPMPPLHDTFKICEGTQNGHHGCFTIPNTITVVNLFSSIFLLSDIDQWDLLLWSTLARNLQHNNHFLRSQPQLNYNAFLAEVLVQPRYLSTY